MQQSCNQKEFNHKAHKVLHKGYKEKLTKKEVFTGYYYRRGLRVRFDGGKV
ncbi:MAG: hypothetical protein QY317_00655 [Candidatus Jettenia caeni]|nr:MAG: hypothetical protein QY317_00655 [Candidatus Jettenia caeni]